MPRSSGASAPPSALALWAVVLTLGDLLGAGDASTGWLLWQLAVLLVAVVGLVRLMQAIVARWRDRARRRRRNAVHVLAGKLMELPSSPRSAGRRIRRGSGVAAAAALACASWATAAGPLMQPASERGDAAAVERAARDQPSARSGARTELAARPRSERPVSVTARRRPGATRTPRDRSRSAKRSSRDGGRTPILAAPTVPRRRLPPPRRRSPRILQTARRPRRHRNAPRSALAIARTAAAAVGARANHPDTDADPHANPGTHRHGGSGAADAGIALRRAALRDAPPGTPPLG